MFNIMAACYRIQVVLENKIFDIHEMNVSSMQ